MKPEHEQQEPFLHKYTDDPTSSPRTTSPDPEHALESKRAALRRKKRLVRDLVVFLLASLLWLGVIGVCFFVFVRGATPSPSAPLASSLSSSSSSTVGKEQSRLHNVTSGATFVSCGNSSAEAEAAGCRYDTLLNHWVPVRCVDQEWIDEYEDDGSWAAFSDENLTKPLTREDMGVSDYYYTSIRDHVNHCAMLWRKQFWTLFEARQVFDGVIVNTYHTEHCAEFLSGLMGMERTEPTLVRVGFSGCWVRDNEEL